MRVSVTTNGINFGRYSDNLVIEASNGDLLNKLEVAITVQHAALREQPEPIQWRGNLGQGEILTIQGLQCSQGSLFAGELPHKPFVVVDTDKLQQQYGLTVQPPLPSAQNGYTLRLQNSRTTPLERFRLVYSAEK